MARARIVLIRPRGQACFGGSCDVSAVKKVYVPLGQGMVLVLFLVAIFLKDIFY